MYRLSRQHRRRQPPAENPHLNPVSHPFPPPQNRLRLQRPLPPSLRHRVLPQRRLRLKKVLSLSITIL